MPLTAQYVSSIFKAQITNQAKCMLLEKTDSEAYFSQVLTLSSVDNTYIDIEQQIVDSINEIKGGQH